MTLEELVRSVGDDSSPQEKAIFQLAVVLMDIRDGKPLYGRVGAARLAGRALEAADRALGEA